MFDGFDYSDPYTTDDRGLWFDGRYDVVALLGLKVHTKFGLNIWARAHGSGTLFSVSEIGETLITSRRTQERQRERWWAISIKGKKLQF